jgi:hypothetical protein
MDSLLGARYTFASNMGIAALYLHISSATCYLVRSLRKRDVIISLRQRISLCVEHDHAICSDHPDTVDASRNPMACGAGTKREPNRVQKPGIK